jgi:hypothetical protein
VYASPGAVGKDTVALAVGTTVAEPRQQPVLHCTPARGEPDPKHVFTSFAERQNLNMRMHMRRFTRLTKAFSKKVENHAHSVALFATYYNFVKVHSKLRRSPAMAAGVADRLWDVADIVKLVEVAEAKRRSAVPTRSAS